MGVCQARGRGATAYGSWIDVACRGALPIRRWGAGTGVSESAGRTAQIGDEPAVQSKRIDLAPNLKADIGSMRNLRQ